MGIEKIRPMTDEVAVLIAARFGGLRRGHQADLESMMRKRGAALPRKLRREALFLMQADRMAGQPNLARQVDLDRLERAHKALTGYLRPLGQGSRLRGGAARIAASVVLGLLILGLILIWIVTWRGLV